MKSLTRHYNSFHNLWAMNVFNFHFLTSIFTSHIVISKNTKLFCRFCRPILTKPKPRPKPPTPESCSPASSQGGESQTQGADQPSSASENAGNEVPPTPAEPMETDKSESAPGAA